MSAWIKIMLFIKQHWKLILGIILTIIGLIVGLIMVLVFGISAMLGSITTDTSNSSCSNSSSSVEQVGLSGTDGTWTHKGTKSYNASKDMFLAAKHDGCDNAHAAAVCGNGLHEGAFFGTNVGEKWTIWPHQAGGGGGKGLYQFSPNGCPIPKDKSIAGQTKQILTQGGGDTAFKHASGSPYTLGLKFDSLVERGDETTDRGTLAEKAYKLFSGAKGSGGSDDASDDSTDSSDCNDNDSGSSNSDIVKEAEHLESIGNGGHYELTSDWHKIGDKNGPVGCCTTFLSYILNKLGYGPMSSQYCPTIISGLASKGKYGNLKRIPASEATSGTLIFEHGHSMIETSSKFYGKFSKKTKVIDMRGNPRGVHGPESYFEADMNDIHNKPYFAKPVK